MYHTVPHCIVVSYTVLLLYYTILYYRATFVDRKTIAGIPIQWNICFGFVIICVEINCCAILQNEEIHTVGAVSENVGAIYDTYRGGEETAGFHTESLFIQWTVRHRLTSPCR